MGHILRRVPGSRLLLKYRGLEDEGLRARYLDLFAAQGIVAQRLEIEGWSPLGELMARHNGIDVALDPFPFAGGVTTCNALWMGVPVVTWPAETFASRHVAQLPLDRRDDGDDFRQPRRVRGDCRPAGG